jgi:phosphocarrier protein HPr
VSDAASQGADADIGALRRTLSIANKRGLHARAAAKFVKLVGQFKAEVTVVKGDVSVSGSSIMGLMMLAAGPGTEIEVRVSGPDAAAAMAAIVELVGRKFDET